MQAAAAPTPPVPRRPRLLLRRRPGPPQQQQQQQQETEGEGSSRRLVEWEPDMGFIRRRYGAPHPPRSAHLLFLQSQRERGVPPQAAAEAWRRCTEQEIAAWVAKAMWDRERHARETAAHLHEQLQQRHEMEQQGGMVLDVDLGHCRPRSMLESASGSASAEDKAKGEGEKDGVIAEAAHDHDHHHHHHHHQQQHHHHRPHKSLHASAADGDLGRLRRGLLVLGEGQTINAAFPPAAEEEEWDAAPAPVGLTPLLLAAACSDHVTVDLLLAHGADPRGASGAPTPAQVAALRDPSALLSLLDLGTYKEEDEGRRASLGQELLWARDASGRSLLHYAALGGNPECVRLLLERGLNPTLRDDAGHTPLDLAAAEFVPEIVAIERLLRRAHTAAAAEPSSPDSSDKGAEGLYLKRRKKLRLELPATAGGGGWLLPLPPLRSPVAAVGALAAWAKGASTPTRSPSKAKGKTKSSSVVTASPPASTVVAIQASPPRSSKETAAASATAPAWNRQEGEGKAPLVVQQVEVGGDDPVDTAIWCDEAARAEREATRRRLAEERALAERLLARREAAATRGGQGRRQDQKEQVGLGEEEEASSDAAVATPSTPLLLRRLAGAGAEGEEEETEAMVGSPVLALQSTRDVWVGFVTLWSRRGAAAALAFLFVTCLMALPWWL